MRIGAAIAKDVVDDGGKDADGTGLEARAVLRDGLAHATVLLIEDFKRCKVRTEEIGDG